MTPKELCILDELVSLNQFYRAVENYKQLTRKIKIEKYELSGFDYDKWGEPMIDIFLSLPDYIKDIGEPDCPWDMADFETAISTLQDAKKKFI